MHYSGFLHLPCPFLSDGRVFWILESVMVRTGELLAVTLKQDTACCGSDTTFTALYSSHATI